eukprot:13285705-Alexandrium_andersonii.AAC.1
MTPESWSSWRDSAQDFACKGVDRWSGFELPEQHDEHERFQKSRTLNTFESPTGESNTQDISRSRLDSNKLCECTQARMLDTLNCR